MRKSQLFQAGFTLIEIAIVLLVVAILLGYTVAMVPVQQELKQYRQVEQQMEAIYDHLIGFAQVNGRLPCPDTSGGVGNVPGTVNGVLDGFEDTADNLRNHPDGGAGTSVGDDDDLADDNIFDGEIDGCLAFSGYLPAGTLGISGDIDSATGRLLDPWGQPYRYAVSDINADANVDGDNADNEIGFGLDLVTSNGVREEGLPAFSPASTIVPLSGSLLNICNDSSALGNDLTCADASSTDIVTNVAAVIISTGKDRGTIASNIQAENIDDFQDGTNDKVYIYATRSDVAGAEYDDVVKWISTNVLFSKMIEADQLP
jgi:prepilin-type N-terminal cleavage/methylation domain-containing protein